MSLKRTVKKGSTIAVADSKKQKSLLSFFTKDVFQVEVSEDGNDPRKKQGQHQVEKSGCVGGIDKEDAQDSDIRLSAPLSKKAKLVEVEVKEVNTPLTSEQRDLIHYKAIGARILKHSGSLKIIDPQMGSSWYTALESEFKKDYFVQLSEFVTTQRGRTTIYPQLGNVWEWTKHCKIDEVKVVILGQDPYHGPNQAHGLCFSVQKGVSPPPSLVNMYKELESDIEGFVKPNHGHLSGWAQQGVLLLNAVLTVEAGKANSHKDKGWEKVTDAVISWISKNLSSVVFLLWGSHAQKKAAIVDKKRHHLLQTVHPSPLSAHRGFLGCKHFSKCNELLLQSGKTPIDWTRLP